MVYLKININLWQIFVCWKLGYWCFAISCLEPVWLKIPNFLNVTNIKNDISGTAACLWCISTFTVGRIKTTLRLCLLLGFLVEKTWRPAPTALCGSRDLLQRLPVHVPEIREQRLAAVYRGCAGGRPRTIRVSSYLSPSYLLR